jgi:CDP-diacylglycerol--glycerol-3-phosphate 3-phosphatidyltransferase
MKFFVNFLSAFRIVAAFAIIPLLMFQMYWTAFIVYTLAGVSDFFDGWLARKYNVETKIGGVMDHIGDKFLVVNTMIMLACMMPVWFVVVPVILMTARELYISGLREFLGTQKIEMPVGSKNGYFSMGKVKAFLQMIALGAFLLIFAMGTIITPDMTSRVVMYLIYALPQIGIWGLWLALIASLWSAGEYTITFVKALKKVKK